MDNADSKINVLWVLNGLGQNGISMFVLTYLQNLDKSKYRFHLGISGKEINDSLYKQALNMDIEIIFMPCRKHDTFHYILDLAKYIKTKHIDIFHIHGNSTTITIDLLAAKIAKCKIRVAHCHASKCDHKIVNELLQPFFNRLYSQGFACSEDAAINMFGKKWKKRKCISILKNGIETNKFIYRESEKIDIRKKLQLTDKDIVLGHIGFFNNPKNQIFLINLIEMLIGTGTQNYKLVLVGDGPNKEKIQALVDKKGINNYVHFLGIRNDIPSILSSFDMFLFPSIFEGLGIAVIEAQSNGLPCILSDRVPQITKILDSTEFVALDEKLWIDKIVEKRKNSHRENAVLKVQEFGWDIVDNCDILQKEYYRLLSETKRKF